MQKYTAEWKAKMEKLAEPYIIVTLGSGTVLQVDRMYIRKGNSDFSSVTFFAKNLPPVTVKQVHPYFNWELGKPKKVKSHRFWAKLEEINTIEFEKYESRG